MDTNISIRQTKHTVVNIISSRETCGLGTTTCTSQLKPQAGTKKGDSICYGGIGGGNNSPPQYKYPLTADEACKSVIPAGTKYSLAGQARFKRQIKQTCGSATAFDVWYDNTQGANMAMGCNSGNYQGCKGYARCCVLASDWNTVSKDFCNTRTYIALADNKKTGQKEDVIDKIKSSKLPPFDCSITTNNGCLGIGNYSDQLPVDQYGGPTFTVASNNNLPYQECTRLENGKVNKGYCCQNISNQ